MSDAVSPPVASTPPTDAAAAGVGGDPWHARLSQAMALQRDGEPDAALAVYSAVPDDHPLRADGLHLMGLVHAQRREFGTAHDLIWQAVMRKPGEGMFVNNLANVCVERGMAREAEALYVRAVELDPTRIDALNNLGLLLMRGDRLADAEKLLARAVELAPEDQGYRQNLARLMLRTNRVNQALQLCHDGLVRVPRSRVLRSLLVLAYSQMGRPELATEVLQAWLALEPDDPYPRHHLAAFSGAAAPERASDAYVRDVFDNFSRTFDAKLADLSYQAPQHVAGALARLAGTQAPLAQVLDAGCGTGLCGPLLQPLAGELTGVDLSEGMLRLAWQRGCYDALFQGELVAFLHSRPQGFDAVVSADTLCYFGVLDGFAEAAHAALRPGGWLVFTVEALADDAPEAAQPGHRLHPHGRYSHGRSHVLTVLRAAGLADVLAEPVFLRNEGGEPVQGWLVSARRPAAPADTH